MIKKTNANKFGVVEYAVSTEEEVAQLPYLVAQGSTCIVIATANVYMFDESDLSWHSLTDGTVVVPNELKPIVQEEEVVVTSLVVVEESKKVVEEPKAKFTKKSKKNSKKVK